MQDQTYILRTRILNYLASFYGRHKIDTFSITGKLDAKSFPFHAFFVMFD